MILPSPHRTFELYSILYSNFSLINMFLEHSYHCIQWQRHNFSLYKWFFLTNLWLSFVSLIPNPNLNLLSSIYLSPSIFSPILFSIKNTFVYSHTFSTFFPYILPSPTSYSLPFLQHFKLFLYPNGFSKLLDCSPPAMIMATTFCWCVLLKTLLSLFHWWEARILQSSFICWE